MKFTKSLVGTYRIVLFQIKMGKGDRAAGPNSPWVMPWLKLRVLDEEGNGCDRSTAIC